MNELFVTEVGSRMWGMEEFASDYDLFHCYVQPCETFLVDQRFESSRPSVCVIEGGKELDNQYMEVGHLVQLLKKGNVNAMWAVCSPIIHKPSKELSTLKAITKSSLSSVTYHSIRGMAESQLIDSVKRATVKSPRKSRATCIRTLRFGQDLLNTGKINFKINITEDDNNIETCRTEFENLDFAFKNTTLPDYPNTELYDQFLLLFRIKQITGGINV